MIPIFTNNMKKRTFIPVKVLFSIICRHFAVKYTFIPVNGLTARTKKEPTRLAGGTSFSGIALVY